MLDVRFVQRWRLRIIEQPEAEFFKDEGGKNHSLEVLVRLEPIGQSKLSTDYKRGDLVVPLHVELFYESEQRVEDVDQVRYGTSKWSPRIFGITHAATPRITGHFARTRDRPQGNVDHHSEPRVQTQVPHREGAAAPDGSQHNCHCNASRPCRPARRAPAG